MDLDLALDHRHSHRITICSTMAVVVVDSTRAPLLHHHHLLDIMVVVVARITKIRTIMAEREDTMTGMHHMHRTMIGEDLDLDAIGVGVVGRIITRMVGVRECIGMRRIRRRDLSEGEIESETSETVLVTVGCYSTRTRRSIVRIIAITIGGTETKTVIPLVNIIILLLLLEAEKEA
jgi:hypothetical protein